MLFLVAHQTMIYLLKAEFSLWLEEIKDGSLIKDSSAMEISLDLQLKVVLVGFSWFVSYWISEIRL